MAKLTDAERASIKEFNQRQAFLAPFKRITDKWAVETQHKFQKRIRAIQLVASGDLESDWSVKVIANETGVIVGEFTFDEHGRLFDMRKVDYSKPRPVKDFIEWVESKVDKRQIRYSDLAERRGLPLTDPRVINDLAYRIARSGKFNPKRRRWYNKGKESSIDDLYDQLSSVMQEIALAGMKSDLQDAA